MIVIAITIHGWFGAHVVTCLGVACFVVVTYMGVELNKFVSIVQLFRVAVAPGGSKGGGGLEQ